MTRRALKPCNGSPICPELVQPPDRYCEEHSRRRDLDRGTPADRGYTNRWRKFAWAYKRRRGDEHPDGEPRCDHCGLTADETGAPLEVDHIDGRGPLGPRGYDVTNLQLLCRRDHQTKTAHQTGTAGGAR